MIRCAAKDKITAYHCRPRQCLEASEHQQRRRWAPSASGREVRPSVSSRRTSASFGNSPPMHAARRMGVQPCHGSCYSTCLQLHYSIQPSAALCAACFAVCMYSGSGAVHCHGPPGHSPTRPLLCSSKQAQQQPCRVGCVSVLLLRCKCSSRSPHDSSSSSQVPAAASCQLLLRQPWTAHRRARVQRWTEQQCGPSCCASGTGCHQHAAWCAVRRPGDVGG